MKKKNNGFLLIEVLVTIAILAFGLVYISRAFMNCLKAMSQIASYTLALNLGEEKLFDLEEIAKKGGLDEVAARGDFPDNPGFSYKLETNKLDDLDLNNLYLEVNWKEGRKAGSYEITTYLPIKE